jgi:hypothetical protein
VIATAVILARALALDVADLGAVSSWTMELTGQLSTSRLPRCQLGDHIAEEPAEPRAAVR